MRSPTTDQGPVAASEPVKAAEPLQRLFELFNVRGLGDGDIAAGANALAAMAATIANVSVPETGLVHNGDVLSVGTSLLVSGALSQSLLSKALGPLHRLQANLTANITEGAVNWNADEPRSERKHCLDISETKPHDLVFAPGSYTAARALLEESESHKRSELKDHPLMFATCNDGTQIANCLDQAHQGRAVRMLLRGRIRRWFFSSFPRPLVVPTSIQLAAR
jgi:hypothetical protein